jgi:hypothetical protein
MSDLRVTTRVPGLKCSTSLQRIALIDSDKAAMTSQYPQRP